jgi:Ca-activated chloride channel family protein
MTIAHPWVLHFLWILPVAGFVLIVQSKRRQRSLERFAEKSLLDRLTVVDQQGKDVLKGLLMLCVLGLLILAMAGPRWGSRYQEVSRKGVDMIVGVDVSPSMMVADVKPNRLERAKREILDLLKVVEGDRVGLTAYARAAFVLCPLTLDYRALEMFLGSLQTDLIPLPGTDHGAAIDTALSAFDFKAHTDKVMLLITDGEDHEQRGLEAARRAARRGVKIFVFGIGEPSGGPVPADGSQGGFKKDSKGRLILSRLQEGTLQQIAAVTGGSYVRSVTGDLDLDLLYFQGIKQATEAKTLKSGKIKVAEERFYIFLAAAFLLLLLEGVLTGKQRPLSTQKIKLLLSVLFCVLYLVEPHIACAAESSADEMYRNGQYAEAEKEYARLDMDHPREIRFRYNRGCAAFRNGKYKEAQAAFASVLRRTQDPALRFKALYNLGNTAFKQGDLEAAAANYKKALAADPGSEDARHNLELALRTMARNKQKASQSKANETAQKSDAQKEPASKKASDSGNGDHPGKSTPDQRGARKKTDNKNHQNQKQSKPKEEPTPKDTVRPKDSSSDQAAAPESRPDQEPAHGNPSGTDSDQKLSGELKPRQESSQSAKGRSKGAFADNQSAMDKKKAQALFDNVQENPSKILRFMIPQEKQGENWSGKDW